MEILMIILAKPIYSKSKLSELQNFAWSSIEKLNTDKIGIWLINPMEWD
jgi:hypothetical protein